MPGGRSVRFAVLTAAVLFVALSLFGSGCDPCGTCTSTSKPPSSTATPTRTPTATPTAKPPPSVTGTVQGALNPVSGATVTLYEVGNAAPTVATAARVKPEDYGEGATSLGSTTTDSSGNFTIQFTPPASPTLLYLVALGGNAGGGTNSAIGLIGVAGQSIKLPKSVTINELTTVAAEWALAQFIDSTGQIIGAPPSNATGLANAANQAQANLANISSGLPAAFWSDNGATEAACTGGSPPVNCDGLERLDTIANILAACVQSSGPSSIPCSALLTNTGTDTTTLAAAHAMVINPVANVAALFAIQGGSPPYTPNLGAAPDGWEIALSLAPSGANFDEPIFLAVDAAGNVWSPNVGGNTVTELNPVGGLVGNFNPGSANFDGPDGVAIDSAGNVWITNFDGATVTELKSSGALIGNFNPDGANFDAPLWVAIDTAGNAWIANQQGDTVTELNSSGGLVGNFNPDGANFDDSQFLAIDASGDVWIPNLLNDSVTELNSSGGLIGNFTPAGLDAPGGVAIDPTGNVWTPNETGDSVTELNSSGGLVGTFSPAGSNFDQPISVAIDSAGNVWTPNSDGNTLTELTSSGGLAANFVPVGAGFDRPDGVAIDASGNVWVGNVDVNSVSEFIGAASPVMTPLVACLKQTSPHAACLP
jgi:streptogramin lyase